MVMYVSSDKSVIITTPNPRARLRLFCFPYAGGGPSIYRTWAQNMPREVEICALQLPGRWSRHHEPPFTRMEPLVEAVLRSLEPELDRPFSFFGHSLGGLIAFEVACRLVEAGDKVPLQLLVSARIAPDQPLATRPSVHLPDEQFLQRMAKVYDGIPQEVMGDPELLELMMPVIRADIEVFETYHYQEKPPLPIPIAAFRGADDPVVSEEAVARWKDHTTAEFTVDAFPGKHFFLFTSADQFFSRLKKRMLLP